MTRKDWRTAAYHQTIRIQPIFSADALQYFIIRGCLLQVKTTHFNGINSSPYGWTIEDLNTLQPSRGGWSMLWISHHMQSIYRLRHHGYCIRYCDPGGYRSIGPFHPFGGWVDIEKPINLLTVTSGFYWLLMSNQIPPGSKSANGDFGTLCADGLSELS